MSLQVFSLACALKGCKTRLFRDFPEIGALTVDPKQDRGYDFLKTCLNNEVCSRSFEQGSGKTEAGEEETGSKFVPLNTRKLGVHQIEYDDFNKRKTLGAVAKANIKGTADRKLSLPHS